MSRPTAKTSPKKPIESPELSKLPRDPHRCQARFWCGGHGGQCWRDRAEGDSSFCGRCRTRYEGDGDFWGFYDNPLGHVSERSKSPNGHAWRVFKGINKRTLEKRLPSEWVDEGECNYGRPVDVREISKTEYHITFALTGERQTQTLRYVYGTEDTPQILTDRWEIDPYWADGESCYPESDSDEESDEESDEDQ